MSEIDRHKIRTYLLGGLDAEDQRTVEELLVTGASLYDELLVAEDELIDEYLANELLESEQDNFERHFLCAPERLQKLRFARTFRRYVSKATRTISQSEAQSSLAPTHDRIEPVQKKRPWFSFLPVRNPILAYSLAAAVLFTMIGISWVVVNNMTPAPHKPGPVMLVELTPGLTRDVGGSKSIRIPPGTDSVQLQLASTSEEHQTYRAELLTGEGASVLVKEDLRRETTAGKKVLNVAVPAKLLKRDDYRLKLSGKLPNGNYEDIDTYAFRVAE